GDAQLFFPGHRGARTLFAITQRGVENNHAVIVAHVDSLALNSSECVNGDTTAHSIHELWPEMPRGESGRSRAPSEGTASVRIRGRERHTGCLVGEPHHPPGR